MSSVPVAAASGSAPPRVPTNAAGNRSDLAWKHGVSVDGGEGVSAAAPLDDLEIPNIDDEIDEVGAENCMEDVGLDHNTLDELLN